MDICYDMDVSMDEVEELLDGREDGSEVTSDVCLSCLGTLFGLMACVHMR